MLSINSIIDDAFNDQSATQYTIREQLYMFMKDFEFYAKLGYSLDDYLFLTENDTNENDLEFTHGY